MSIKKYRKKPVVIEAIQLLNTKESLEECIHFAGDSARYSDSTEYDFTIGIRTPEGMMQARVGDYIIKGVKGEFYPCKPDIFDMTYEYEPVR